MRKPAAARNNTEKLTVRKVDFSGVTLHIMFMPGDWNFLRIFARAVRELDDPELRMVAKGFCSQ